MTFVEKVQNFFSTPCVLPHTNWSRNRIVATVLGILVVIIIVVVLIGVAIQMEKPQWPIKSKSICGELSDSVWKFEKGSSCYFISGIKCNCTEGVYANALKNCREDHPKAEVAVMPDDSVMKLVFANLVPRSCNHWTDLNLRVINQTARDTNTSDGWAWIAPSMTKKGTNVTVPVSAEWVQSHWVPAKFDIPKAANSRMLVCRGGAICDGVTGFADDYDDHYAYAHLCQIKSTQTKFSSPKPGVYSKNNIVENGSLKVKSLQECQRQCSQNWMCQAISFKTEPGFTRSNNCQLHWSGSKDSRMGKLLKDKKATFMESY